MPVIVLEDAKTGKPVVLINGHIFGGRFYDDDLEDAPADLIHALRRIEPFFADLQAVMKLKAMRAHWYPGGFLGHGSWRIWRDGDEPLRGISTSVKKPKKLRSWLAAIANIEMRAEAAELDAPMARDQK